MILMKDICDIDDVLREDVLDDVEELVEVCRDRVQLVGGGRRWARLLEHLSLLLGVELLEDLEAVRGFKELERASSSSSDARARVFSFSVF